MTNEFIQAVENENLEKIHELILSGVDINSLNEEDEFALGTACWKGNKEIVELLIKNGANVNLVSESEFYSALMMASTHGHAEIVHILIRHGADVKAEDDYNATALTRAAEFGHLEIVKLLLQNGANPNLREERGKTAQELAEESDKLEVAEFIRNYSKN